MIEAPLGTRNEEQFQEGIVEDANDDDEEQREALLRKGKSMMWEDVPYIEVKFVPAEK